MTERQFKMCELCNKNPALISCDVCRVCASEGCSDKNYKEEHDGDPCKLCGYKRTYSQGDDIGEIYRDDVPDIERQAQLAAWGMRRAICDIAQSCYGVKTEALETINEILGTPGVEYKLVKNKEYKLFDRLKRFVGRVA